MSLNHFVFLGNLTRDVEYRAFASGGVANFTVAVNNRKKNSQTGQWENDPAFIDCACWDRGDRKKGTTLKESFSKGSRIIIIGSVRQENWEDKTTGQKRSKLKVDVADFDFVDKKDDSRAAPRQDTPRGGNHEDAFDEGNGREGGAAEGDDGSIPF